MSHQVVLERNSTCIKNEKLMSLLFRQKPPRFSRHKSICLFSFVTSSVSFYNLLKHEVAHCVRKSSSSFLWKSFPNSSLSSLNTCPTFSACTDTMECLPVMKKVPAWYFIFHFAWALSRISKAMITSWAINPSRASDRSCLFCIFIAKPERVGSFWKFHADYFWYWYEKS